jgi:hypothetical protein
VVFLGNGGQRRAIGQRFGRGACGEDSGGHGGEEIAETGHVSETRTGSPEDKVKFAGALFPARPAATLW